MNSEGGYSSITVLIIILFLSSITLSVLIFLQISARQNAKREYFYSEKEILDDEVNALIEQLAKDPTAEADSQFDPVWDYIETRNKDKTTLTLEDISSRFNLNFIRTKMLENSSFRELLINGHTSEDLKLYRGEKGFFSSISEGYGEYFEEEDLQKYFTTFSYANLNVTYEDSLKKLYEYRVSEEGSHSFLNEIQQLISETQM
ncbi:MAG: hypothetical protein JEY91_14710, partial [Spirochaetaceae bacterium]|nr:hypothetical protein [Spirochaetaceae bacterium]